MRTHPLSALSLCVGIALCGGGTCAQEGASAHPGNGRPAPIAIERVDLGALKVAIDGRLSESVWSGLPIFDDMMVIEPDIAEPARYATGSRIFYTDKGIYVGIQNEQPPETLVARLSGRDSGVTRDGVRLVLDTSGEGLYGYFFQLNLGDSISDGIVLPERRFQGEWDGPWHYATKRTERGWTAEMFLPWSMMSLPDSADGARQMGVSIDRKLAQLNERWAWPALPNTQPKFMSALQPILVRDVKPQQQYSVFPYVSSTTDRVRDDGDFNAGVDLFWRPSANFLLSATVKPDFGQVEADDVVINLSAFETFFPEKRLFFLENQEIFITSPRASRGHGPGGGGGGVVTLVNTRRIGASVVSRRDLPDYYPGLSLNEFERNQPVDLLGAVKATGQVGSFRLGVLTAFEDDTPVTIRLGGTGKLDAPGRDFAIARAIYEKGTGGGRRALGVIATLVDHPVRQAKTFGLDGHLLTDDGVFEGDVQLLFSDVEGTTGSGAFANLQYSRTRGRTHRLNLDYYDEEIEINDFGYLRRNDQMAFDYSFYFRQTEAGRFRDKTFDISLEGARNGDGRMIEGDIRVGSRVEFDNKSRIFSNFAYNVPHWDDRNSDGNGSFKLRSTWGASVSFWSDFSKPVSVQAALSMDKESTVGYERDYRLELQLRPDAPWNASINLRYIERDGWLIHSHDRIMKAYESTQWRPRINLSTFFSAHQEIKLSVEWAGVKAYTNRIYEVPVGDGWLDTVPPDAGETATNFSISDLTIQLRYRWELAPLSDLYVVYSRGGSISGDDELDDFAGLLDDAFSEPEIEFFIVKLRYRFGS